MKNKPTENGKIILPKTWNEQNILGMQKAKISANRSVYGENVHGKISVQKTWAEVSKNISLKLK